VRVLCVDDNPASLEILEAKLSAWGAEMVQATDGLTALRLLRQSQEQGRGAHVVLVDREMPGMDGLSVVRSIRSNAGAMGRPVVLMLTSLGTPGERKEAETAGVDACLGKPVRDRELWSAISEVMSLGGSGEASPPRRASPSMADLEAELGTSRVLVVEDNPVNLQVAMAMLRRLGCRVISAADGAEALEELSHNQYDLVLMDCQMPVMDGLEATRRLRVREGNGRRTPVVALTAGALVDDRRSCLEAGMDGFLTKPVQPEALAQAVRQWTEPARLATATMMQPVEPANRPPPLRLDTSALQRLAEALGPESASGVDEIVSLYLEDAPRQLHDLQVSLEVGKLEVAQRAAHSLKSTSRTVGALHLGELAAAVELQLRSGQVPPAGCVEGLRQEYQAVVAALAQNRRAS
jgi:CheY-like chemotaxis protein/HPt (histidine-containing phosphotransfer) domain-containing protein